MFYQILAMTVCVILSGYFSATETAFSSVNRTRLRSLAEAGSSRAELTLKLSENYDKLISTILIGNNIVNIAVASIGTLLFVDLLGEEMGATVSTAVITIVVLIFGEITPKSIAKDYPEKFAMFSAPILRGIIWFFTPLNFLFTQWKKLVSKLFRTTEENKMSPEELLILLDEVQQEGAIDEEEGKLLKKAVNFGELEAQDILTHRVDLVAVSLGATKEEIAACFDESRLSRIIVYEDNIDKIVGVIHQKDFYTGGGITEKSVEEILAPPLYVHQTEKIDNLLQTLRAEKSHLAIVVDEYGGTLGIVTMEDILEELVGEIWDEHDEVEEPVRRTGEHTYLVDGGASMGDLEEWFDAEPDTESTCVGGWVMDTMGRIPGEGEQFTFENLLVKVVQVNDHRVETVEVTVREDEE